MCEQDAVQLHPKQVFAVSEYYHESVLKARLEAEEWINR